MLPKENIVGDTKTIRDMIITLISLLSFAITKKITKSRLRLNFIMLMRLKKNKIGRTEGAKVVIVRR